MESDGSHVRGLSVYVLTVANEDRVLSQGRTRPVIIGGGAELVM